MTDIKTKEGRQELRFSVRNFYDDTHVTPDVILTLLDYVDELSNLKAGDTFNGLVIVPLEPTEDMIEAACKIECALHKQCYGDCNDGPYAKYYKVMIEAAKEG